jgi:hypothetical protein
VNVFWTVLLMIMIPHGLIQGDHRLSTGSRDFVLRGGKVKATGTTETLLIGTGQQQTGG